PGTYSYPATDCEDCCLTDILVFFEYSTVLMEPGDIYRGNLILVNYSHPFDLENKGILVPVAQWRTPSFGVARDDITLAKTIIEPFVKMMDAYFEAVGTDAVTVISGFRCPVRQQEILDEHISRLGEAEARRWVSLPGHSEHHTGLAMDLGFYHYGAVRTFLGTGRTAWFGRNAHNFGFILRFPENKEHITHVTHEPWHFRYVGLPHSYFIYHRGWVLEEYISFIKEHDAGNPLIDTFQGLEYEIYFTKELELTIPYGSHFEVSGSNTGGFIVTLRR
ncbi:MAG: M15 family metallopeptidase, partial [Oscillospiraceae bacterium]|nr:M15 family metallopeptidase [Oscillospiraceae bacterium]